MDQIVAKLTEQLGLSEEVAEQAVGIVVGVLKEKLPEPIAGQIDGLLQGEGVSGLGGLLG